MYLSIFTIELVFSFLLCQRVNSVGQSVLHDRSISNDRIGDDVLENFLVEFIKPYLAKSEFRQIMVIARETSDLLRVQPLLEIHPYVICQQKEQCGESRWLSQRSLVIIFLGDLSEEIISSEIKELSKLKRCKFLFIYDDTIHVDDIRLIFNQATQRQLVYVKLAHVVRSAVRLYAKYIAANCSVDVQVFTVWRPGGSLPNDNFDDWTDQLPNLNGCPVFVSTFSSAPKMIIEENEDGSSSIAGGSEGLLILTLAEKLNFNISLICKEVRPDKSRREMVFLEVAFGDADIGIGNLAMVPHLLSSFLPSSEYDEVCITWGVPRRLIHPNDIVWVEFKWQVWILVGLTFVISCVIGYTNLRMISTENGKQRHEGFVTILLDAVAIHLGLPVVYVSSSATGQFMLLAFLCYSIVITTAYKSSLAATMTANQGTPAIVDVQGIVNANFTILATGSVNDFYRWQRKTGNEFFDTIVERFLINNNECNISNLFMNNDNYVFLGSRSVLQEERQKVIKLGQSVNFDIFDGCEVRYPAVIDLKLGSELEKPINKIIRYLKAAGILNYWDTETFDANKVLQQRMLEEFYENRATDKFRDIFIFYSGCVAFCLLTFFIELLTG